jgi:phage terminase Nu1 subunit (DNA packaging protein)
VTEYLSARKFADLVGVSNVQISKLVKQGRLPVNEKGQIPRVDGLTAYEANQRLGYENNRAHNARVRKENASKRSAVNKKPARPAQKPPTEPDQEETEADDSDTLLPLTGADAALIALRFNKAKAEKAETDAKVAEIKLKQMNSVLVERSLVFAEGAEIAARTKEVLDTLPARLAPQCEGKTAGEIQGIIYDGLQIAYSHINNLIKQGQPAQD